MKRATTTKLQKAGTLLRDPRVQRILAWLLPIIFGWILSKLDTKPKQRK